VTPDGTGGGPPADGRPRHAALETARRDGGISNGDLWLHYFSLTGDAGPLEVEAYLQGLMPLPAAQQDILTQALRECLTEQHSTRQDPHGPHGASPTS